METKQMLRPTISWLNCIPPSPQQLVIKPNQAYLSFRECKFNDPWKTHGSTKAHLTKDSIDIVKDSKLGRKFRCYLRDFGCGYWTRKQRISLRMGEEKIVQANKFQIEMHAHVWCMQHMHIWWSPLCTFLYYVTTVRITLKHCELTL